MPSRYSQHGRSSCSPDQGDSCHDDYLQDPEMWEDSLPQPFRMIDELLEDLLLHTWDEAERRREIMLAEALIPRIPVLEEASVTVLPPEATGLDYLQQEDRELLAVGSKTGVHLMKLSSTGAISDITETSCGSVTDLKLGVCRTSHGKEEQAEGTHHVLVFAVLETGGVQVYGLIDDNLVPLLTEIPDVTGAVSVIPSPSHVTHLTITSHFDSRYQLQVFSIPAAEWAELLDEKNTDQSAYQKPALVLSLTTPSQPLPCTTTPAAGLKTLADTMNSKLLPNGQTSLLMDEYLQNRKRLLNHYCHVIMPPDSEEGDEQQEHTGRQPIVNYLYHFDGKSSDVALAMAVRWEEGMQISIYSLLSTQNNSPVRLYPFTSPITATCTSPCSPLLCVGLYSGIVELLNTSTGTCWGVVSLGNSPVSSLLLTSTLLIAGLSNGGIHTLSVKTLWPSSHKLTDTAHNLSSVTDIRSNSSLHSTVTSLHADGTIVIWDLAQSKRCCQLALPPSYVTSSSLTTTSQCSIVIAQEEGAEPAVTALFCWGLGSAEPLRRLWLEQTEEKKDEVITCDKAGPFDNLLLLKNQQERLKTRWAEYKQGLLMN